jgi:hypothetical protein
MLELLGAALLLVLDIWAIMKIIGSSASTGAKTIWVLVVFFFPVLGLIAWFFAGPKGGAV